MQRLGQEPKLRTRRSILRKVHRDRCSIIVCDRRNKDRVAKEERMVNDVGIGIIEPERVEQGFHLREIGGKPGRNSQITGTWERNERFRRNTKLDQP